MSLSDKIRKRNLQFTNDGLPLILEWLPAKDVKKAIKELKEELEKNDLKEFSPFIDKVFGKELK